MKGTPKSMQNNPKYSNVVEEIIEVFGNKIEKLNKLGANNLIIDPGFGFGKNLEHNYTIINNLEKLKKLKLPILIGVSRKSLIYNLLEINPEQALNGTTSVNTIALLKGANILRVHDVKEAAECIKIVNFAQNK
jgi:dihydropteroate synthase